MSGEREQNKKIPISLLIGRGSRVTPLLLRAHEGLIPIDVVSVISHKALDIDEETGKKTKDVPGIALAKSLGIRTAYFNLVQMTNIAKEIASRNGISFDSEQYREYIFFPGLAEFICQSYPVRPEAVFMNGWDLIVPPSFQKYFLGPGNSWSNVINFHPSLLPERLGAEFVTLLDGRQIPVLKGEETQVLTDALRQKLPAIGVTMHYVQALPDAGGSVIDKVEIPIFPDDTFESLRARHIEIESKFMADSIDRWARARFGI